jgi:hypothetical protein
MSGAALDPTTASPFPIAAKAAIDDTQLRKNVRHATEVIQSKRAAVVRELPDWPELREAGLQIRQHTMAHLDFYLGEFERNCTRAGGVVHWARDAREARQIVVDLVKASGSEEVIKIKSMTTEVDYPIGAGQAIPHRRSGAAQKPAADSSDISAGDEPSRARGAARGSGRCGADLSP